MRTICTFFLFAWVMLAQVTVNIPSVTVSDEGAAGIVQFMGERRTGLVLSLAGDITAAQTSVSVVSAEGVTANQAYALGAEQVLVTGRVDNTLTVVRGHNRTTPAAAAAGAEMFELRFRTLAQLARALVLDGFRMIVRRAETDAAAAQAKALQDKAQTDAEAKATTAVQ